MHRILGARADARRIIEKITPATPDKDALLASNVKSTVEMVLTLMPLRVQKGETPKQALAFAKEVQEGCEEILQRVVKVRQTRNQIKTMAERSVTRRKQVIGETPALKILTLCHHKIDCLSAADLHGLNVSGVEEIFHDRVEPIIEEESELSKR